MLLGRASLGSFSKMVRFTIPVWYLIMDFVYLGGDMVDVKSERKVLVAIYMVTVWVHRAYQMIRCLGP